VGDEYNVGTAGRAADTATGGHSPRDGVVEALRPVAAGPTALDPDRELPPDLDRRAARVRHRTRADAGIDRELDRDRRAGHAHPITRSWPRRVVAARRNPGDYAKPPRERPAHLASPGSPS
jgi:hypothetical protein